MLVQSFVLRERDMVLLSKTLFDKLEQISHYKSFDNPPYIYSPKASCSKHGWMEGPDSTSNQEMDILDLHTSHLTDMKAYRIDVPNVLSSAKYPDWKI